MCQRSRLGLQDAATHAFAFSPIGMVQDLRWSFISLAGGTFDRHLRT